MHKGSCMLPAVPTHPYIDRYEVRGLLGRGAMGSVYVAWDSKLHREVALKLINEDLSKRPRIRERFHLEARAVAALRHPNIVEVYDYSGADSRHLYMVMERLRGRDLRQIVEAAGPMPEAAAAAVTHELCLALQLAHEAGIIHRDLKPENVFIDGDGRVVLTDFGVVKAIRDDNVVGGESSKKTEIVGTPGFMAPEMMLSNTLGPFTDVYALGIILYNMLTGALPFDGRAPMDIFKAAMAGKYKSIRLRNPTVSDAICALVDGALQPRPKKRIQTAEELRRGLKNVLKTCGTVDIRDELRDYMRDPVTYTESSRQRTTEQLLHQLKVAIKDRNEDAVRQLHARVRLLDAGNPELQHISGVIDTASHRSAHAPIDLAKQTSTPSNRRLVIITAITAVVVGVGLGLIVPEVIDESGNKDVAVANLQPIQAAPQPALTTPRPAAPPAPAPALDTPAKARIFVNGGGGMLFVDGKRWGRASGANLSLTAGPHTLEVRRRGQVVEAEVTAKPGEQLTLVADFKKGELARMASNESSAP